MRFTFFLSAILVVVPVFSKVVVKKRYLHAAVAVDKSRTQHMAMGVLARKRSFEYTPLIKREDGVTEIGSFDLGVKIPEDPLFSIPIGAAGSLSATCIGCFTTGIAKASTTGFETDDNLLENVLDAAEQLVTDPDGFLASALSMNLFIALENLGGHFEFDIGFDGTGSLTVPIFHPITPLGGEIQGNEVGIIFTIDLVFTVEAAVGFTTGFDIFFPKGASFSFNPISGDLLSITVDGLQASGIPFTFKGGSGTFTVALRIGLKAGLGVSLLGTGFELETGIYVDVPTYNASIVFDPAAECQLDFKEGFFGVAAAYAQAGVSVNYIDWTAGPSTAVTFFTADLPGGCIASRTTLSDKPAITTAPADFPASLSTGIHANSTILTTTHTTVTVTTGIYQNGTAPTPPPGIKITSPAAIIVLPTPIPGGFTPGSSVSIPTAGTSSQAIAPAISLVPGQQAPTAGLQPFAPYVYNSSVAAVTYITASSVATFPGFVGAQTSTVTRNSETGNVITTVAGIASPTNEIPIPQTSTPIFPGANSAVRMGVSGAGILLAGTAAVFVCFL
ncbi:hypothetical protein B0O99DRAFT_634480 [Bisporella sp. PMI_857]|nr:hypothetical protein B0O99DRAFT_634480 [Bisporella sp. PMI_857]